ncbi:sensor histidine kinase [Arthrobacter sp. KK5.5]|uniref:sensor histidine kinase n=1 Tax=Arthrobacter sp. KK5.5 TaxID=3373084 RepID=UPI003EE7545E
MLRTVTLRSQLLLLQVAIMLLVIGVAGVVAATLQAEGIREAHRERMVGVAGSVARLPSVVEAYDDADPAQAIQPIAELIRQATNVTYVVVTDADGIRYSHPVPGRIGERVSTDPSVPLSGETFVGTETGTLGSSWRVKVPVRGDREEIIGSVSVGILESEITDDLMEALPVLAAWLAVAAVVGGAGAFYVSRLVWLRIHRQEPEQIAELLTARDAMLHGIGEGVVATDSTGRVTLVNDEATRLLGLGGDAAGRPARDILEASVARVLDDADGSAELVLAGERVLVAKATAGVVGGRSVGGMLILRDHTELHRALGELTGERDTTQALRAQAHEHSNRMHVISGLLELGQTEQAVDFIGRMDAGGALWGNGALAGITDPEVTALLLAKTVIGREKDIEVAVDPESAYAPGDARMTADLVTILGNLVDNALEAVGHDGRIEVLVASDDDGAVVVEVHDDGPGIAAGLGGPVWGLGVSGKAERPGAAGGRGIGLALVRRVVDRRAGTADAGASEMGGACFALRLPSGAPAATPSRSRTPPTAGAPT